MFRRVGMPASPTLSRAPTADSASSPFAATVRYEPMSASAPRVGLEDRRVDADPLERHRGDRAGDAAADDQSLHGFAILSTVFAYHDYRVILKPKDIQVGEDRQALIAATGRAMQAYQRSTDAFDDAVAARLGLNRTDPRCLD